MYIKNDTIGVIFRVLFLIVCGGPLSMLTSSFICSKYNSRFMFPLPFAFKIYFKIHISHLKYIIYHIITICQYVSLYIVL